MEHVMCNSSSLQQFSTRVGVLSGGKLSPRGGCCEQSLLAQLQPGQSHLLRSVSLCCVCVRCVCVCVCACVCEVCVCVYVCVCMYVCVVLLCMWEIVDKSFLICALFNNFSGYQHAHTNSHFFFFGLASARSGSKKPRRLWTSVPGWVVCELTFLKGKYLDSIVIALWPCGVKGVCVFRCNLPAALLAELPGSFTAEAAAVVAVLSDVTVHEVFLSESTEEVRRQCLKCYFLSPQKRWRDSAWSVSFWIHRGGEETVLEVLLSESTEEVKRQCMKCFFLNPQRRWGDSAWSVTFWVHRGGEVTAGVAAVPSGIIVHEVLLSESTEEVKWQQELPQCRQAS